MTASSPAQVAAARGVRVYRQGASIYVIGTDDTQTALRAAGITPETHRWGCTLFGLFVRRQGQWRAASDYRTTKAAKPGVGFIGPVLSRSAAVVAEGTQ